MPSNLWLFTFLAVLVLALIFALIFLPDQIVGNPRGLAIADRLKALSDVRTMLLQAGGGTVLFIGLTLTWRTLQVNRQGDITDRLNAAVTQLDGHTAAARTGAIHALGRVARDSREERLSVGNILATFIRERRDEGSAHKGPVPPDVQAAILVLGRRPGHAAEEFRLDLSHCDLTGAEFRFGLWDHANFVYSRFDFGTFTDAHLRGAHFAYATALTTSFGRADLRKAIFGRATVQAWFHGADLRDCVFDYSTLSGSDFSHRLNDDGTVRSPSGVLAGASFKNAILDKVDFCGVDLSRTKGLTADQLSTCRTDERTVLPLSLS